MFLFLSSKAFKSWWHHEGRWILFFWSRKVSPFDHEMKFLDRDLWRESRNEWILIFFWSFQIYFGNIFKNSLENSQWFVISIYHKITGILKFANVSWKIFCNLIINERFLNLLFEIIADRSKFLFYRFLTSLWKLP